MSAVVQCRIKVPNKESLEHFMANWNKIAMPVVPGECAPPKPDKTLNIDMQKMSHVIRDIRTETFDPKTNSVVADIVFTGPMSSPAVNAYSAGGIRFLPRAVAVNPKDGDPNTPPNWRLITWDLVTRPDMEQLKPHLDAERQKLRAAANAKDKATELAKKRIRK